MKRHRHLCKFECSLDELGDMIVEHSGDSARLDGERFSWFGGTPEELRDTLNTGEPEIAEKAESLFDEFLQAVMPETQGGHRVRRRRVAGSTPNVPAAIAGRPDSMYRFERQGDCGPVRLFISMTCAAGVKREEMLERGIALSALIYALQTIRPVELYLVSQARLSWARSEIATVVRIGTAPFDLQRVATAVSHLGWGRYRLFDDRVRDGAVHACWGRIPPADLLDLGPDDVYVPGYRLNESKGLSPIQYVHKMLGDQADALLPASDTFKRFTKE